eukprot:5892165-Pyramimonas_sp.AAC.2
METDMWHSKACFAVRTPGWVFTTLATRVLDVYAPHVLRTRIASPRATAGCGLRSPCRRGWRCPRTRPTTA